MIKLTSNTIDDEDIDCLCNFLKTNKKLTYGNLTKQLEESFAKKIGCKYSVFVNSGSSANLLMLSELIERGISKHNRKIVVPALSWATDLAPVMQLGLTPILCDCNLQDLSVDLEHLESIFKKEQPSALMLVSVLGIVPRMDKIIELCDKYHVVLLEDNCESMLSSFNGKNLGCFGYMSSFSTFHSHHISTVEGGFITTNDEYTYELLLMLRSHGWDRELPKDRQEYRRKTNLVNDFDAMYKFYLPGFNVRPTEISAFLGLRQMEKLDKLCVQREANFQYFYSSDLFKKSWKPISNGYTSSFALPLIAKDGSRKWLIDACKDAGIECRPLISGSMSLQPVFIKRYGYKKMKNAEYVDKNGLYLPNNHSLTAKKLDDMLNVVKFFI